MDVKVIGKRDSARYEFYGHPRFCEISEGYNPYCNSPQTWRTLSGAGGSMVFGIKIGLVVTRAAWTDVRLNPNSCVQEKD